MAGCVAAVAAIWIGAAYGLWFLPFAVSAVVGYAACAAGTGSGIAVLTAIGLALAGWALAFADLLVRGWPIGATARIVAALAGLPPEAAVAIAAVFLIAALQAAAGTWLGLALRRLPPPRRRTDAMGPPGDNAAETALEVIAERPLHEPGRTAP